MVKLRGVIVIVLFLFGIFLVQAGDLSDNANGATISSSFDLLSLTETSAGSDNASGGVVTQLNLSSFASTLKWQGYIGTVTANVSLGSSSEDLFSFGSIPKSQINSVFATPGITFDFSGIRNINTQIDNGLVDSFYGFPTADADSMKTTYEGQTLSTISGVGNVRVRALNSYSAGGVLEQNIYYTGILSDTLIPDTYNDLAYAVGVVPNKRDFRNASVVDYQLIVPVDSSQTYYFYMDID